MVSSIPWSVRMAESVMQRCPILDDKWNYEAGVVLEGIERVWQRTGDARYLDYIQQNIDAFVQPDGSIRTYTIDEYNVDRIKTGRLLYELGRVRRDERYQKAIFLLRDQLRTHPRTSEGGFWHKQVYPHQMWLDGLYMHGPFYAQFARTFDDPAAFDDVTHQFILAERHMRDAKTGLFFHGWDETHTQHWSDPDSGTSLHFWGRALGWYMMAIVDVLDYLPREHPQRARLITILRDAVSAVARVQDAASGVWYQVLDQGTRAGNYLEASASCMYVYAVAKGVRGRYLDPGCLDIARRGYEGILRTFIEVDEAGLVNLHHVCSVAGLGGTPYRSGTFEYYVGEPVMTNDPKGAGAFILASDEMERTAEGG